MSGLAGLPAPANLAASINGEGTLDYTHDAVPGATGYEYEVVDNTTGASTGLVSVGNVTGVNDIPLPESLSLAFNRPENSQYFVLI